MLDRPAPAAGPSTPSRREPPPQATEREKLGDSLAGFASAIRQRRLVLIGTIILVPLCTWITLSRMPPQYTATGSLIYEPSEYRVRELESIVRADPTTEALMVSQAEVLQSLHIAQKVAERGNLFDNPAFNAAKRPPGPLHTALVWLRWLLGMEIDAPPRDNARFGPVWNEERDNTLLAVKDALHAEPVRFSHVIAVSFTAPDPVVAAAAVNNAMDVYIKDQYAAKHRMVENANRLLDTQASDLRKEVRRLEERISSYRGEHGLSQGVHAGTDTEEVTELTDTLARARTELAGADARLDAVRSRQGALAQADVAPSVVQLRSQVDALSAAIQAQSARLGPAHPEAQSLAREFADAKQALAAEVARVVAATIADQHAAAQRVASLEAMLHDAEAAAQKDNRETIPLNAMQRDLDAARSELQAVLERMAQTAQQAEIESSEAHEITEALPPSRPSAPKVAQTMAASVAASIFLGLLLVYALQLADGTLRSGDDLRAMTALPCMALVPEVSRRALGRLTIEDYVVHRPLTVFAEQLRALRVAVSLDVDRPQIVAITAAGPAEGKSVLTLAYGRSAQRGGEQVMAIECDVRQPCFRERLRCEPMTGLMDVLRGEADWREVVREDPLTGLEYITAGKPGGDALALFQSQQMRQMLDEMREHYTLVLLDAPPVEAIAESRMAATLADATLVCVRWRRTPARTLLHALDLLRDARATVIGAVLTRVDPRAHRRSGYADAAVYHRRYKAYYRG
jgi:succinoglycan biosynthesis transport protein ExoP